MNKFNKKRTNEYEKRNNNVNQSDENNSDTIINKVDNHAHENNDNKKSKIKFYTKRNILIFFIPLFIFINIYLINNNPTLLELNQKIKELETKIEMIDKNVIKKKIGIAFVNQYLYINGIARYITVLTDLLVKTGKYDVYLINEESTDIDYHYNKKIKRIIQKKDFQTMKDFDEEHNIDIYILNNDLSNSLDIYKSFDKKVIGIYHGVYLSCIYNNETLIYRSWQNFGKYDSFIHIIPDDYFIYKKFGFTNTIYIPNINTFDSTKTPSSNLVYKNLLIGRLDVEAKGGKYGLLAMAEILKEVPEAKLTILGLDPPKDLQHLAKKLNIENSVYWPGFSTNITEFYLNTSVLLIPCLSESFRMIINEAKAHGLPIVAFNIDYEPSLQTGVITVNMFDYNAMAKETIKLLNNYNYRRKKGEEAKLSLNNYKNNNGVIDIWDRLFKSLVIDDRDDYTKLQEEIEKEYYNETKAKSHLEKHYHYAQNFNHNFKCHSFNDMINLSYINNIEVCPLQK